MKADSRRWMHYRGWGLSMALALGIAFLAGPSFAQERVLSENSPATDIPEIQTPIQQVFPEPLVRISIFGPKIQRASPFFADTFLEVRARTYYWNQDALTGRISEAWAIGGSLYYHSGWLGDLFAIEAEGFTSQPLYAPVDRQPTGLLEVDGSGYSALGILNANLKYAGVNLKGGRLYHNLPYMGKSDSRMTPNTFEAITVEKPGGDFKFTLGYTSKIKSKTSDHFVSMTEHLGLDVDHGLAHGGVVWEPGEDFNLGAIAQVVPDVMGGVYGEALWFNAKPNDKVGFRLDSQGTYERKNGDNLLDLGETWNIGIRGSLDYRELLFQLGFCATGPEPVLSPFGANPSYLNLMSRTFTHADEKAMLLSLAYDLGGVGAHGFKANLTYAQSYDAVFLDDRIRSRETDLTLDYRGTKGWWSGLWIRLRQAWQHESWTAENLYQLRVQVFYTLNVI